MIPAWDTGFVVWKRTLPWLALALIASAAAAFAVRWYRSRPIPVAAQLQHMPQQDAVIVYIDFHRLRQAGILHLLDSNKGQEDSDYREFAGKIGLNWQNDLDSALLALTPSGKFMLITGRFDWPRLRSYARNAGGACFDQTCRLNGSTPERRISFLPLGENLMALAVSTDEWAVRNLQGTVPSPVFELPDAPVWVRIPGAALRSGQNLPDGTRMFARSIAQANFAVLALASEGKSIAAKLDVHCADAQAAAEIAGELSRATAVLRDLIAREHQQPNPADLSGLLAAGNFWSQGARVYGHWPIQRALLESLLGGA
jgi:hypothetical protein